MSQCYGCQQVFKYNDLAYECMCYHKEEPHYRGVCHQCTENKAPLNFGEGEDPNHHHLKKIHQFSEESKRFWKEVEEKCPCWNSFTTRGDKIVFIHPNFPEGVRHWNELTEQQQHDLTYSANGPRTETEFPITYKEFTDICQCICCN